MKVDKERLMEVIRFGIVGCIATAIHYTIYLCVMGFMHATIAYSIGYIISFCANFLLSNYFTFHTKPTLKKGIGFALSHIINYLLHIGILNGLLYLGISKVIAPLFVFAIVIPVNFILVRLSLKKL